MGLYGSYAVLVECNTKEAFTNIETSIKNALSTIPDVRLDSVRCRMMSVDRKGIDEMEEEQKRDFEVAAAARCSLEKLKKVLEAQDAEMVE